MRQIRQGVFETNSSSSHSISIRKVGDYYTESELDKSLYYRKWDDWKGVVSLYEDDLEFLEFGRTPFRLLTDFWGKFKFAIASFADDKVKREEVEAVLKEVLPKLKSISYPKAWGSDDSCELFYGDIDHQIYGIYGLLQGFLEEHNLSIREFLLNSKYVVWIDGDEYCIKNQLFNSGLLHKEDFEEEEDFED